MTNIAPGQHGQHKPPSCWISYRMIGTRNIVHLAVVYDNLKVVQKLGNEILNLSTLLIKVKIAFYRELITVERNYLVVRFLLNKGITNYEGADQDCLGH